MINRKHMYTVLNLTLALVLLAAFNSHGASIKDRMVARIPSINTLKDKGIIGENNQGFLEFRSKDQSQKQMVQDENKDRGAVYGAIAQKQGVSAELVGQRRAKQIAEKGSPGHWYQDSKGKWYKK